MVLAQGASASQAERNWKIYGRIMTPQRAASYVFGDVFVSAVSIRHQQRVVRDAHTHCAEPSNVVNTCQGIRTMLIGGPDA